jgi:AcrR family transcriptional regulator
VSRSVVYRDFADRDDLDRALQTEILDRLWRELLPAMRLEGTFYAALERIIRTYVDWAVAHPRLHQRVDHDTAVDGDGPLQKVLDLVAERVAGLLVTTFTALGAEVTDNDRLATDPLVHGLVGSVFSAVRRWVHLGSKVPDAAHLSEVLTEATWAVLSARAASYGFELRPDHDLAVLVGARGRPDRVFAAD